VREIGHPVLAVALAGNLLSNLPVRHEQREDGEEGQAHDERKRDEEVGVERHVDAAQRPHDSQGGDKHHEDATDEQRHLQDLLAVGAATDVDVRGGGHGGHAQKQGKDVEGADNSVTYAEHVYEDFVE